MIFKRMRYENTEIVLNGKGQPALGRRLIPRKRYSGARVYVFKAGDRLDLIAYREYGDPNYKYAIMDANPSFLSELHIKPGHKIVVPKYEDVVVPDAGDVSAVRAAFNRWSSTFRR